VKYDDASWHHGGGDFPEDLPEEAAATHTGMFLAWALMSGFAGPIYLDDPSESISKLQARSLTPGQFFLDTSDGKFVDEDLNEEGNAFAQAYFDLKRSRYLSDYEAVLVGDLPSQYHVPDTWRSYDTLKPLLDQRLAEWRQGSLRPQKPWWKFWNT
jgi:hypothetical protein